MITEYEVTFAVKEYLLQHGWHILAFNPPGAQGTFTIPNPGKKRSYRGQTGSLSPDLIAVKDGREVLIVESKKAFSSSDAAKMSKLLGDDRRKVLILAILDMVCRANDVPFDPTEARVIPSLAHAGKSGDRGTGKTFVVAKLR